MKINKIKITNDEYFDSTILNLFSKEDLVSVIYGKNGSGKTTLSNAIKQAKNNDINYSFLDENDQKIELSDEEKNNIYVFNEDYIDKNCKVDSDGINAIVLFGDVSELNEKINIYKKEIEDESKNIENRNIDKYHNHGNPSCIDDVKNKIIQKLQGEWSKRQQQIKKNAKKSPVTEQIMNSILDINFKKTKKEKIEDDYNDLYAITSKINPNQEKIDDFIIEFNNVDESKLVTELNAKYDKKETSDLVKRIIKSYENYNLVETTKKVISVHDNYCPLCFQAIDSVTSSNISKAIDSAFDETIENAQKELRNYSLNEIECSYDKYKKYISLDVLDDLNDEIVKYNEKIQKYKDFVNIKTNKIYDPLNISKLNLKENEDKIADVINNINSKIKTYNDIIDDYNENIKKLEELNKQLASFEIKEYKEELIKLKELEVKDIKANEESNNKIETNKSLIKELNAQKKNINVAMKEINKELSIIFSSSKRLYLQPGGDSEKYYIYSKGKKIKLNKLSTGERNLIALIYFIEEMKKECKENEYFKNELFVVIDDPISSFDFENKFSIYSYINKIIKELFEGNHNSKVIIMSHERDVVYTIIKKLDGIRLRDGSKIKHTSSHIYNKKLINLQINKKSDYTYLLDEVYEFAEIETIDETFVSKGNEIRKLIEIYSTFNYKRGIDELFSDEKIIKEIDDEKLRDYFKYKNYGIVLNAESHLQQQALQFPNIDSFDLFSEDEQIRIAREILCFMYLIHKTHIELHLEEKKVAKIKVWLEDIRKALNS